MFRFGHQALKRNRSDYGSSRRTESQLTCRTGCYLSADRNNHIEWTTERCSQTKRTANVQTCLDVIDLDGCRHRTTETATSKEVEVTASNQKDATRTSCHIFEDTVVVQRDLERKSKARRQASGTELEGRTLADNDDVEPYAECTIECHCRQDETGSNGQVTSTDAATKVHCRCHATEPCRICGELARLTSQTHDRAECLHSAIDQHAKRVWTRDARAKRDTLSSAFTWVRSSESVEFCTTTSES